MLSVCLSFAYFIRDQSATAVISSQQSAVSSQQSAVSQQLVASDGEARDGVFLTVR